MKCVAAVQGGPFIQQGDRVQGGGGDDDHSSSTGAALIGEEVRGGGIIIDGSEKTNDSLLSLLSRPSVGVLQVQGGLLGRRGPALRPRGAEISLLLLSPVARDVMSW